jgi:hypothetical protein
VPDAAARAHPLDAAGRQDPLAAIVLEVLDGAVQHDGDSGDARVRVHVRLPAAGRDLEQVEEDEGFQDLAGIAGAEQAGDAAVAAAFAAMDDAAACCCRIGKTVHMASFSSMKTIIISHERFSAFQAMVS